MPFNKTQTKALAAKLNASHVKTRIKDGITLSYIEGWHVIAEANRIFDLMAGTVKRSGRIAFGKVVTMGKAPAHIPRKFASACVQGTASSVVKAVALEVVLVQHRVRPMIRR